MTGLKPCPKCGEKINLSYIYKGGEEPPKEGVVCDACGFEILTDEVDADVDWLWNSRGDENALRPCPFCGSEDLNLYYYDVDDRCNPFDPCVRCNDCETVFKFRHGAGHDLDDILKVWNGRVKG